jgi:hypothetical protein
MPRQEKGAGRGGATELSRVGNLGCIRFPKPLRSTAGIKRGDRLLVRILGPDSIRLDKIELGPGEDLPPHLAETVTVAECACETPPESCRVWPLQIVTVGWSYVQLNHQLATELGFLPDAPLELSAEPSSITVALHNEEDLKGIGHVTCPP